MLHACGVSSGGGHSPTPASDAGQRLGPLPPYEEAHPVNTRAYKRETVSGLWRLSEVEPDDRTIKVTVATGGCLYFSHMTLVRKTKDSITLAAWNDSWSPTKPDYGCNMELRFGQYRVQLPETLRGRKVDGQCVPGNGTVAERQCPPAVFTEPRMTG